MFGPTRDGVKWEWRKLHNEELNDLYSSPDIVRVIKLRRMRWAGHVGETCAGLWRKREGKRPLGRSRRRWEDNVKKGI
jgi:diadenosine tetraphosphatase ApaH/serine/threonine PP2A family protein phosphatase